MRKFQVFIVISLLSFNISGQSLTFKDLKSLVDMDTTQAKNFLLKRNYIVSGQYTKFDCKNYRFSNEWKFGEPQTITTINFHICCSKKTVIEINCYPITMLEIENQAKSDGLLFTKTIQDAGNGISIYSNSTYEMWVMSKCNGDSNLYEISLGKK